MQTDVYIYMKGMCMRLYTLLKEYYEILKNTNADATEVTNKTWIALKHTLTYKDVENSDRVKNTEMHLTDIHQGKPLQDELIC